MVFVWACVAWMLSVATCSMIGHNRGRTADGVVLGMLLGFLGIPVAMTLPPSLSAITQQQHLRQQAIEMLAGREATGAKPPAPHDLAVGWLLIPVGAACLLLALAAGAFR